METIDVLKATRALIDTPEKWTKGAYARDARGRVVGWLDPGASCFCVQGAFHKALGHLGDSSFEVWHERVSDAFPAHFNSVQEYNDHPDTTHADIMAVFDRAIAAEEAKQ